MAWLNFIILDVTKPLYDSVISLMGNQRIILRLQSVVETECNNAFLVLLKAQEMTGMRVRVYLMPSNSHYTTATTSTIVIGTMGSATATTTKYFIKLQLKMNKDPIYSPTK